MTSQTPSSEDVRAVAASLSVAQRRAVLTDDNFFVEQWKGHWSCGLSPATSRKLFALGLIEKDYHLARPTPLGHAVRAFLQHQDQDNG